MQNRNQMDDDTLDEFNNSAQNAMEQELDSTEDQELLDIMESLKSIENIMVAENKRRIESN